MIIVLLLVFLFGLRRLVDEDIGLVLRGVKDNDQSVRASGINVTHLKALAVFIASFHRLPGRRISGPSLHVGGTFPFRAGFFHHSHCGSNYRRRGIDDWGRSSALSSSSLSPNF